MADVTLTNIDNLLYELRVPMQKNYRKQHVLSAELKRIAPSETFDGGSKGRIPLVLNSLQGGGNPGESGLINVPHAWNTAKAEFTMKNVVQPIGITLDAEEDSVDNSAAEQIALLVTEARNSLAEIVNDQFNFAGALLATVTAGTSPGLVVSVSTSATNWDAVYPGRVVDVLTRSTGADPGQGKRRKIDSVDEVAGTITFSTTSQASDGGSGNMTLAATAGLYIPGTYGNALASIHDIASGTGTFQGIDRAVTAGWKAVDGRGGVTTTVMLSTSVLDKAVRAGRRNGGFAWDLGVGEPAVIDGFKQDHYSRLRYNPKDVTLDSGFRGVQYEGSQKPIALVPEDRFQRGKLVLVPKDDIAVYHGRNHTDGPNFDKQTGSMWQRFNRALPKEAWLRDKIQLAAKRCNRVVFVGNLDDAG